MKKLLALIGSPRKGDTLHAVKRFEEELSRLEEVRIDYVMLRELELAECTGCHSCIMKGREFCREDEKLRELQTKMETADAVILASPVYNQQVTALMKKFMDYCTFFWHRPELFGIKFMGVSSGGGMFGGVFKYMKSNVESWGGTWVGSLGIPHYEALTDLFRTKVDGTIRKEAVHLLKALEDKKLPKPSLGRLMMFNIWKLNATASKFSVPKDFEHWTKSGWFGMDYYYAGRINPFKKVVVRLVTSLARRQMGKVYNGY